MNIELIKKYKAEFDHFINGGSIIKLAWDYEDHQYISYGGLPKDYDWKEDGFYKPIFIINDEYVEFRKALAEGKTIQYKQNRDVDFSDIPFSLNDCIKTYPHFGPERYRIKPEEPQFKVGDFVRGNLSNTVCQVTDEMLTNKDFLQVTKWTPQAGEFCVYPNGYNSFACSKFVSSEEQQLGKGTITLALFENGDSYDISTVEPFLNSKPSWFKD